MSDGRVNTGHVDGERAHVQFAAGDVTYPIRTVTRDKATGHEVRAEFTLDEAQRHMEVMSESITLVLDSRSGRSARRGIQSTERAARTRGHAAGGGR